MKPPTQTYFFLGANSECGFYSLYDCFCNDTNDLLHIIKGGPGTGKSTFMKRIGKAAEAHGLDVEYILCSGDPTSLDGVYIPDLHIGWADGTAPHVLEPHQFGISAIYENLGRFCKMNELQEHRAPITALTEAYRQTYQTAYSYLKTAASLRKASLKQLPTEAHDKLKKRAHSKIKRELSTPTPADSKPVKRFIQAISCNGISVVSQTLNTLCSRLCVLESNFGLEQIFFREILKFLIAEQGHYILCPDPLCPDFIQAIILPREHLCFLTSNTPIDFQGTTRTIHLDCYLPKISRSDLSANQNLYDQLIDTAVAHLKNAKKLHDDLEQCYRPALQISALNEYTEEVITRIF